MYLLFWQIGTIWEFLPKQKKPKTENRGRKKKYKGSQKKSVSYKKRPELSPHRRLPIYKTTGKIRRVRQEANLMWTYANIGKTENKQAKRK